MRRRRRARTRLAEGVLRDAEQPGQRLEALLLLLASSIASASARGALHLGADAVGPRRREDENEREHEQADEQPEARRAAACRRQSAAGRRLLLLRRRGDRRERGVAPEPRYLRDELGRLSRPSGRDVVEPPGPLQLVRQLGVDALEGGGRRRAVVPAIRLARYFNGPGVNALLSIATTYTVVSLLRRLDRVGQRRGRARLVAVGDDDDDARPVVLFGERLRREHDVVVERRALDRVDLDALERSGGFRADVGKGHDQQGRVANDVTQSLSVGSFPATNALAAAVAASSGAPRMEREWSTARQRRRAAPRFCARTPEAGMPFSISWAAASKASR